MAYAAPITGSSSGAIPESQVTNLVSDLALKAPKASPTFTGTVTTSTISGNGGLTLNGNSSNGIILCGDVCPLKFNGAAVSMKDGSGSGGGTFNLDGGTITNGTTITATTFVGALTGAVTGNVTGNVSGSAASITGNVTQSQVTGLATTLALKAPLAAPTFTSTATFTGNIVTPIINGNGSTGLILNGNSSAGIVIAGDASPVSISGLTTNTKGLILSPTETASSTVDSPLKITPTYNQSSTAGSTDILINRTETILGSGSHMFMDMQIAGTSKFSVDRTGAATGNFKQLTNTWQTDSAGANRMYYAAGSQTLFEATNGFQFRNGSDVTVNNIDTNGVMKMGSSLANMKLALYDNNTGSAYYGFGVQAGYVVAVANDVQTAFFSSNNGGSLGVHQVSPQAYLDIAGAVAPAAVGVEDMLYLTKPTQGGVSFLETAAFSLGRWATTGAFEPKTRLDIKLKDAANGTAAPEVTVMTMQSNGAVGVGQTAPTATLDVGASTTSKAALRLRSGTAPTSPNDGDIWYDGTNLKIRVGGTTKTVTIT
jgi:hypothetical protein